MKVFALKVRPKNFWFYPVAVLEMIFSGMNPFGKKAWSHNALQVQIYNENFIIHSTSKGVHSQLSEDFYSHYKLIGMKELKAPENIDGFDMWRRKITGRKYDYLQVFGILLRLLGLVSFNKIGHNYKKMICCEVLINYIDQFYDFAPLDSDNYGLINSWELIESL